VTAALDPDLAPLGDGNAHTLPGISASIARARGITGRALTGHPQRRAAMRVVAELVTVAVTRSASGLPGGELALHVSAPDTRSARVEVTDAGPMPPAGPAQLPRVPDPLTEGGLAVTAAQAEVWGVLLHPNGYRSVWGAWGPHARPIDYDLTAEEAAGILGWPEPVLAAAELDRVYSGARTYYRSSEVYSIANDTSRRRP
jgi:hypothetical protein